MNSEFQGKREYADSEEQKIFAGRLFCPAAPELVQMNLQRHKLSQKYSSLGEDETEVRETVLKEMIGSFGEGSFIQGPVFFHYGVHTSIGDNCFFNYNLTRQDDARVSIGDNNNFGPNFTVVTPVHPLIASERNAMLDPDGNVKHLCYARPVNIGNSCWFGAGVTVCPGVTIGDNVVIGAGSVVTRDIPSDVFAAGVPCRVIRRITEDDSIMYKPEISEGCRPTL